MYRLQSILALVFCLSAVHLTAQTEPAGLLIYQEPASTYTETLEYRSFRQENALYCTLTTSAGGSRKLKASEVVALVPYPPAGFDRSFEDEAVTALDKIAALKNAYPRVRSQLEIARGKWGRALEAFRRTQQSGASPAARAGGLSPGAHLPAGARLTGATTEIASVTYTSGVTTFPLSALSAAQILSLNATSRTVQLPLGLERPAEATPPEVGTAATKRIEMEGRQVIAYLSQRLGVADTTFSVWTFFVVFPGLILTLLITIALMAKRPRTTLLTTRRPTSSPL